MEREKYKKEALFNEIKGHLFEYLVARELSVKLGIESTFYSTLSPNQLQVLQEQDLMLRQHYPSLCLELPLWAKKIVNDLFTYTPHLQPPIKMVRHRSEEYGEADLVVNDIYLSLKLIQQQSRVNTKSAGAKSFLKAYFCSSQGLSEQEDFNIRQTYAYEKMKEDLFSMAQLTSTDWKEWREAGLSELPGELAPALKERLYQYYAEVCEALYQSMQKILSQDPEAFRESLFSLMGHGHKKILQVICFTPRILSADKRSECEVKIIDRQEVGRQLSKISMTKKGMTSFFDIHLKEWSLQIRPKPMNKFTTGSFKINCSLKF